MFDGMDAPTESNSERNGFLSYAGEWHALAVGVAIGAWAAYAGRPELVALVAGVAVLGRGAERLNRFVGGRFALHELKREPWYSFGGAVIGFAAGHLAGIAGLF